MSSPIARTILSFQTNAKLYNLTTVITSITPFNTLAEPNRLLFKTASDDDTVVTTKETIFHPQGGGQPSDVGEITSSSSGAKLIVSAARMDAVNEGQVLHLGRFESPDKIFKVGEAVTQSIDVEKRLLYSRYHTAGHVLGAAVRHLLEEKIEGFDELKASHVPDAAACEFQGLIEGKWKGDIQERLDAYVQAAMPVEIDFWDEDEFRKNGLERLIPNGDGVKLPPGEKYRVVKIVGAEVYPCGGTHVDTTDQCGKVGVKKISRNKGTSRVGSSDAEGISADFDQCAADLGELADLLAKKGFKIAYENWCWATHAPKWKDVWEIVRKANRPNLGLCLDSFQSAGGECGTPVTKSGLIEDIERHELDKRWKASSERLSKTIPPEKIFFLQISDAYKMDPPLQNQPDDSGLRPRGQWSNDYRPIPYDGGYLPVEDFTNAVLQTGFRGWFSVEVFDGKSREKCGDDMAPFAAQAFESLQKLLQTVEGPQ